MMGGTSTYLTDAWIVLLVSISLFIIPNESPFLGSVVCKAPPGRRSLLDLYNASYDVVQYIIQCCTIHHTMLYNTSYNVVQYIIRCCTIHHTMLYNTSYNVVQYIIRCCTIHHTMLYIVVMYNVM